MINDDTKYDFGGDIGNQTLGAIKSIIGDTKRDLANSKVDNATLALSLTQAKQDLQTESLTNQAQVTTLQGQIGDIAKSLGCDATPDAISGAIATLIAHEDHLDQSQRLNKQLIQKPILAVIEDFINKLLKRK